MATLRVRRGSSSAWSAANPVLALGELGYDTTTNQMKVGNGSTAWNSLAFLGGSITTTLPADFQERVEDIVGSQLVDGTHIDSVYNDTTGKITINAIDIPTSIGEVEDLTVAGFISDDTSFSYGAVLQIVMDNITSGGAVTWADVSGKPTIVTNFASLVGANNKLMYFNGAATMAFLTITDFIKTLFDDGSSSAARTTLDVYSKAESQALVSPSSIMGVATIKGTGTATTVPSNGTFGASAGRIPGLAVTVTGEGRPVIVKLTIPSYRHSSNPSVSQFTIAQGTTPLQSFAIKSPGTTAPGAGIEFSVTTGTLTSGVSYTFYAVARQPGGIAGGTIDSDTTYPSELLVSRG